MQATPLQIIKRGLRLIGAIPAGEEPSADQLADSFSIFQSMLDGWATESLFSYAVAKDTFAVSASAGQVSMGTGGNITSRPNKIEYVYWNDKKLELLNTRQEFDAQLQGAQPGTPEYAFFDRSVPLSYIRLSPVNSLGGTVTVGRRVMAGIPATTSETMELQDGYKRAMEYNFAVEIAPEFELEAPNAVVQGAVASKAAIKAANITVAQLSLPDHIARIGETHFDINNG